MSRKKILLAATALCCACLLSGCKIVTAVKNALHFGEAQEFNYGVSALQWLPEIEQKAKTWRTDAYLFAISEAEIDANGNSNKWAYLFYSPSSGKSIIYTYEAGYIAQKETVLSPLNPVQNLKIDTPTALYRASEAAKKFQEEHGVKTRVISLIGPPYENRRQKTSKWQVVFYGQNKTHAVVLDAETGAALSQ
ncbi:hypothetical protein NO2_1389 [Candidatus Termititenax persephonae]|uniref:PepSY domain-containing protein n=1 Tax=Candidatus Termititenax persephonae TaxID=2218525 RepID=A0A388TI89_9BACT|nr:hypothetical protein NO2_1389 [Candidatus Termititenax persephonae]